MGSKQTVLGHDVGASEDDSDDGHQLDQNVERRARGVLERVTDGVADDGSIEGLGIFDQEGGTWAVLSWEDAQEVPGLRVAPFWFTVDLTTGDYETNEGNATAVEEVTLSFVELDDASRLTLAVAVTDLAGNTTITSGPVE